MLARHLYLMGWSRAQFAWMNDETKSWQPVKTDCSWRPDPCWYGTHSSAAKQWVELCNWATVNTVHFEEFSTGLERNNVIVITPITDALN